MIFSLWIAKNMFFGVGLNINIFRAMKWAVSFRLNLEFTIFRIFFFLSLIHFRSHSSVVSFLRPLPDGGCRYIFTRKKNMSVKQFTN